LVMRSSRASRRGARIRLGCWRMMSRTDCTCSTEGNGAGRGPMARASCSARAPI
jgi:hypothetical protein